MIDNVQNMTILSNYYDKKDFAGLIDYCNYKIELDNSNYLFLGARGKAYFELNEYDKAILDITKALDLNPSYATGLYNRGICYYETDKYELAIKDLEQAKLLSTELYSIDFYLGGSYCCIKNYEKAIELLSNHLLDYEDEVALKWRADIYYLTDQYEKANNDLAELLLIESQDIEVFEKINKIKKSLDTISDFDNSNKLFPFINIGFSTIYNNNDCGIYILEFSNNEYYIGQATKIQDRIKQHFKKYNDIVTVYFKPVVADLLLSEENITISIFEKNNLRIRNLKQLDFLNLFNEVNQEKWVNDLNFNMLTGSKFNNEPVREKFRDRFLIFKGKPYFNELILLLSQYFKLCIPNYLASEFNYWNITCLPKYLIKEKCVLRININAVPVLSVFETLENSLSFIIFSSRLSFIRHLKQNETLQQLSDLLPTLKIDLEKYFEEKTEGDEICLSINQNDFQTALNDQLILSSIKLFNLRMMNNVGKELKYRRTTFHCLDLSDVIINRITQDEKKNGL